MEGIPVAFEDAGYLAPQQIYAHAKRAFLKHKGVDAIYLLGSWWRILDIVKLLEQDLRVTVVYALAAKIWNIQK
jgi:maleate cis-trans isomerase